MREAAPPATISPRALVRIKLEAAQRGRTAPYACPGPRMKDSYEKPQGRFQGCQVVCRSQGGSCPGRRSHNRMRKMSHALGSALYRQQSSLVPGLGSAPPAGGAGP